MKQKLEIKAIVDVSYDDIKSAYITYSFVTGKEILNNNCYKIISLEQMAKLRIHEGKESSISKYGNYTREAVIYVPQKGIFLTKKSPMRSENFPLTPDETEVALSDSCKISLKEIPSLRLSEEKLSAYAFGSQAKAYGEFLNEWGVDSLKFSMQDFIVGRPVAYQTFIGKSNISGPKNAEERLLHSVLEGWRVRGIQKELPEDIYQKTKLLSIEDILKLSKSFVPSAAKIKFEERLKKFYE